MQYTGLSVMRVEGTCCRAFALHLLGRLDFGKS